MTPPLRDSLGFAGQSTGKIFGFVGGMGLLFRDSIWWMARIPFTKGSPVMRREPAFTQLARVGVSSLGIVFLVVFFVGMILALQMAYILKKFGAIEATATIVSIGMVRELSPLLTAIVMSGFVGASIAAEIGTMNVGEEILALECSALDPVRFLVVPRLFATMLMIPAVTVMANVVGIAGGWVIATQLLGMSSDLYIKKAIDALVVRDVVTGLIKVEAFAVLIGLVACYEGLSVTGGAEGGGRATTTAVVFSIVSILVTDCFFTALFYFVLKA
ncbi:MAG: ABC transporter permease [Planctomycetes bacterium]|nr:ABC transporter permease [Planctomycetota bacterium]